MLLNPKCFVLLKSKVVVSTKSNFYDSVLYWACMSFLKNLCSHLRLTLKLYAVIDQTVKTKQSQRSESILESLRMTDSLKTNRHELCDVMMTWFASIISAWVLLVKITYLKTWNYVRKIEMSQSLQSLTRLHVSWLQSKIGLCHRNQQQQNT